MISIILTKYLADKRIPGIKAIRECGDPLTGGSIGLYEAKKASDMVCEGKLWFLLVSNPAPLDGLFEYVITHPALDKATVPAGVAFDALVAALAVMPTETAMEFIGTEAYKALKAAL
jgi:hypothetical protein